MSTSEIFASKFKDMMEEKKAAKFSRYPSRTTTFSSQSKRSDSVLSKQDETKFEKVFAAHLWNKTDVVFDKYKSNSASGRFLQGIFSKLASIEESYAYELTKLVRNIPELPCEKFEEGKSLCTVVDEFKSFLHKRAEESSNISGVLKRVQVTQADDTLTKSSVSIHKKSVLAARKSRQSQEETYEKAKKNYDKFEREESSKMTPGQIKEFAKSVPPKKRKKYETLSGKMQDAEIALSMVETVYQEAVTKAMDSVQALELQRVDILLQNMVAVLGQYSASSSNIWKQSMKAKGKLRSVDRIADLKQWVYAQAPGTYCPWLEKKGTLRGGRGRTNTTATTNPFSRAAIKQLQWKKAPAEPDAKTQEQARRDKERFDTLQKQKKKLQKHLKKQRKREEKERLEAETQKAKLLQEEREIQIEKLEKEKRLAEERLERTQQERNEEDARREQQLRQLLLEKTKAEAEKQKLQELLQKKEAEMHEHRVQDDHVKRSASEMSLDSKGSFKTPIIIDNGRAFTKVGFSGQANPSLVVPNIMAEYKNPLSNNESNDADRPFYAIGSTAQHIAMAHVEDARVNTQVFSDQPVNWDDMERFWLYLYDQLGADPREHPVLVTQPCMAPLSLERKMKEIFFEKFDVPAMYVATSPLLSAYAYGASSGLVVDVGHSSAQIVPLIDGYMLAPHVRRSHHLGGFKDTKRIYEFLHERARFDKSLSIDEQIEAAIAHSHVMASSIKDRLAFCVPTMDDYNNVLDVLETVQGFVGRPDADPESDDANGGDVDESQTVPIALQVELLKCGEVMFDPKYILDDQDESIISVPEMIADVVSKCDVDTRRTLLSNVFLSGGVPTMPGFKERLTSELREMLPHAEYIHLQDAECRYASFVGGSVLTSLEDFQESWVFRDEYVASSGSDNET